MKTEEVNNDMFVYYNERTREINIDQGSKITTLDIPDELTPVEARVFLQSDTLYSIISQLIAK